MLPLALQVRRECRHTVKVDNHDYLGRLTRTVFHERNVLMSCRVVNHIGLIFCEHLIDSSAISDRADQHLQIEFRIFIPKLKSNGVSIVFINIEDDQLLRIVLGNLSAKFASDRTTASCDRLP